MFDLGISKQKLEQSIVNIRKVGVYFIDGYFCFDNNYANYYITGGKTDSERQRQVDSLPENIKKWVNSEITIGQLLVNDCPTIETITPIPNIIPKYSKIEDCKEEDFETIATKYNVPVSFVKFKYDDMINWHEMKPQKNRYSNYYRALCDWVKKDSLKIKQDHARQTSDIAL